MKNVEVYLKSMTQIQTHPHVIRTTTDESSLEDNLHEVLTIRYQLADK